jgi:hypothetical protein
MSQVATRGQSNDNSLIASTVETQKPWTGFGPADAVQGVYEAVESRNWVAATLAGVGAGFEAASWVMDPLGSLVSSEISWLLEHIGPLNDFLLDLTGDPDVLLTHAQTWSNMATEAHAMAEEMWTLMEDSTAEWVGSAAESYRALHTAYINAVDATGWMFDAMRSATEGAATLIQVTYEVVRDLLAELVTFILFNAPIWIAMIVGTAGLATPVVAVQAIGRIVAIAGLVFSLGSALVTSFQSLQALLAE